MEDNKAKSFASPVLQVIDISIPVVLHFMIFQLSAIILGKYLDAGGIATVAALITGIFAGSWYRKEWKPHKNGKWYTLWIPFVIGIAGNLLFSYLMNVVRITDYFSNETQERLFQSNVLVQLLGIGVIVPIVEEVIFRGLVFGKLRKYYGVLEAVIFSALLFAFYHGNIIQMLYAFPMGLMLALVYEKWGRISAPVLLHIGANLFGVIASVISS